MSIGAITKISLTFPIIFVIILIFDLNLEQLVNKPTHIKGNILN